MSDDDDGPPPVRSAHVRPPSRNNSSSSAQTTSLRRRRGVDPRFEPLLGNAAVARSGAAAAATQNYAFLYELQDAEEAERQRRMRCLRCVLRRCALEEAGEDTAEYDCSEDEHETFGADHLHELAVCKRTPAAQLQAELATLQRASTLHRAQSRNRAALQRKRAVKATLLRNEAAAVRTGAKTRMFFPKRRAYKEAVLADTYDALASKGGRAAAERYAVRKQKRHRD